MKFICLIILQLNLFTTEITKYVQDFKSKDNNKSINVSISIRSEATGKEVYAYNSESNLAPASTMKLVTTATALEYLSGKYKLETMIYSNGRVVGNKINGDLLIEGIGDPTFGSKRFEENPFQQILKTLKENEIDGIEGNIRVLNNEKTKFPLSWLIADIGNYYGAFSNNFNFNENMYTVYFNGGTEVGQQASISKIYPHDKEWKIRNLVTTGTANSGDGVNILNIPFSNDIQMVGTVPLNAKNFPVKGAIPNVNSIFTDSLTTFLKQNGITVKNKIFEENLQNEELGSVISPDLTKISKETNFESVNIFADGLANFMWETDSESYNQFLKSFWKEKGLDLSGHNFNDGSGLAPGNAISCQTMTNLLYKVKNNADFLSTLPVVGKEGTVKSMGKDTNGKIKAKSGSIAGVRNYSGYYTANNGKKYVFSIFTTGFNSSQSSKMKPFFDGFFTKMLTIKE